MKKLTLAIIPLVFCFASASEATVFNYIADLSGANEFPANASPGVGAVNVIYDSVAHTLFVSASFSGLLGNTTAAHIHCCTTAPFDIALTAAVATQTPSFIGFPLGVTSGIFSETYDLTDAASFRPGFITAAGGVAQAEAMLAQGLFEGRAYFNIHTLVFPGGEIRDFLRVPEPSALALIGMALASLGARAIRRRRG